MYEAALWVRCPEYEVSSRYGLISIIWYKDTQIIDIDILDNQIDKTIIRQNKKEFLAEKKYFCFHLICDIPIKEIFKV